MPVVSFGSFFGFGAFYKCELQEKYSDYQSKLLDEGIITRDNDLAEMEEIKTAIEDAAQKQELAAAIA